MKGTKPTRAQAEVLRKNNRFPGDFLYLCTKQKQDEYKNNKGNRQRLDRDGTKKSYMVFKNRSEGFIIELEVD